MDVGWQCATAALDSMLKAIDRYKDNLDKVRAPIMNMNQISWIGVYPRITDEMISYMLEIFKNYLDNL